MKPTPFQSGHAEHAERWAKLTQRAQQLMIEQWGKQSRSLPSAGIDPMNILGMWKEVGAGLASDPQRLFRAQQNFGADSLRLWQTFLSQNQADLPPVKDKRFSSTEWAAHPAADFLRRSYLLAAQHVAAAVEEDGSKNKGAHAKAQFAMRQFLNAVSPSNIPWLNPDTIKAFEESGGESALAGFENFLSDLEKGRLTQVQEDAFEVGNNIANSPGKVIFENELMQLIEFAPSTAEVYETPLVIFPAWINKYYILDLSPRNSFVKWAVDQGITVFIVSWVNPDERFSGTLQDDYIEKGYLAAIEIACEITGAPAVNAVGYCVAGTTLAIVLAYLAAIGKQGLVKSATFLTSQLDFSEPGEIRAFVDEGLIDMAIKMSEENGYLEGRMLASMFNLLRSNDLIWNYVVNNYMAGKPYQPFDLLYWNSDSTNVPVSWLKQFVEDNFFDGKLAKAGAMTVLGTPTNLRQIDVPLFAQTGKDDHIAPASSCYKITQMVDAPTRFVLAGSGHVAGVINPPGANKYQHWISDSSPSTFEEFLEVAQEVKGSWWPEWLQWLTPNLGAMVDARQPGVGPRAAIEDAPGRYVRVRS